MLIKSNGFTLIEVIVSLALLGMLAVTFLPILTFGMHSSQHNVNQLVAQQLASSQIEWLRTLDYYNQLGLKMDHYKPHGIVEENLFRNQEGTDPHIINGIEYRVRTKIYWEATDSITQQEIADASKKIDVTVYAKNPFTKTEEKVSTLNTLITFEGQREFSKPGNMKIYTMWQLDQPKPHVLIEAIGPSMEYIYTDSNGRAIIADIEAGEYTVTPKTWNLGEMMIRPLGVTGEAPHQSWKQNYQLTVPMWNPVDNPTYPQYTFFVDFPARLRFPQEMSIPESATMTIKPASTSYTVPEGKPDDFMTLTIQLNELSHKDFWWNWQYEYFIQNEDDTYLLTLLDTNQAWDGQFLKPANKAVATNVVLHMGLEEHGYLTLLEEDLIVIDVFFSAAVTELADIELKFTHHSDPLPSDTYYIELANHDPEGSKQAQIYIHHSELVEALKQQGDNELEIEFINSQGVRTKEGIQLAPYKNKALLQWVE